GDGTEGDAGAVHGAAQEIGGELRHTGLRGVGEHLSGLLDSMYRREIYVLPMTIRNVAAQPPHIMRSLDAPCKAFGAAQQDVLLTQSFVASTFLIGSPIT